MLQCALLIVRFFFFNDTAPSEISSLSLPDALSISKLGENVAAVVVLRANSEATSDQLRQFARKRLAAYKVPSLIRSEPLDRKSTRLNSSHTSTSYAAFSFKKKKYTQPPTSTPHPHA